MDGSLTALPFSHKAQENPHRLCPQPVGGLERKRGRLAAARGVIPSYDR